MSQRKGAPYRDRLSPDGKSLLYIGHDAYGALDKDQVDQPLVTPNGTLTQNGLFFTAAINSKATGIPEFVRVYEKLHQGVWAFNGLFTLVDARLESDGVRNVCVFELKLVEDLASSISLEDETAQISLSPGRLIPSDVKLAVYKRDKGMCVKCAESGQVVRDNLHFDHILPFSLGGSSTNADNIQLLCQRHNLEKSAKII